LYQSTIKQGDFLLNRIQKLSRVIDIWSHKLLSSASFISFSWFWSHRLSSTSLIFSR
jgi:hypothetical protein